MTTIDHPGTPAANAEAGRLRLAGRRAFRVLPTAIAFALVWTVTTGLLVHGALWWREAGSTDRTRAVVVAFLLGAALGGLLAPIVAAAVAGHRPASARFSAMFVALVAMTGGGILLVYAIRFRLADPDFWWSFPHPIWLLELAFTMASAGYTLMVSGIPLLLPHGLPVLFAAAWWFARRPRG